MRKVILNITGVLGRYERIAFLFVLVFLFLQTLLPSLAETGEKKALEIRGSMSLETISRESGTPAAYLVQSLKLPKDIPLNVPLKDLKDQYGFSMETVRKLVADYFEAMVKAGASGKNAANWMQTELLRRLNDSGKEIEDSPVAPAALAELLKLVESGQISGSIGKKVFATMFESGRAASEIVAAEGLAQISDTGAIEAAARDVIAKNPDNVAKFKSGNEGVFKFFVGQVMRATKGQGNPQAVNDVVRKLLTESN